MSNLQEENITKESPSPKYFTPSIEDIRVGYECELLIFNWKKDKGEWIPTVLEITNFDHESEAWALSLNIIRVPYLTKEQIEAEGWESVNELYWEYKKGHMHLLYDFSEKILQIMNLDFSRETTRRMG